jgi:hypothetical protein
VAASLVPSLEDVMANHFFMIPVEVTSVQFAPESVDVQMFPSQTTAASLVPSLEDVMPLQSLVLPTEVSSVHVAPESEDVQMFPRSATAASLVPSLEDVMPLHSCVLPVNAPSVQLEACVETSVENESRATSRNLNTLRRSIVTSFDLETPAEPTTIRGSRE